VQTRYFKRIMSALEDMSPVQLRAANTRLTELNNAGEALQLTDRRVEGRVACPNCETRDCCSWGRTRANVQRYRCATCHRTFTALTGTPFSHTHHKSKLLENAQCMAEFMSVRKTARRLGVHRNTAFRLRHLMMPALNKHQPQTLEGVAEADEMYFRKSYKGRKTRMPRVAHKRGSPAKKRGLSAEQIPVFTASARGSTSCLIEVLRGPASASRITRALRPLIKEDVVLCTDSASAYKTVGKTLGILVRQIPRGSHKLGPYHIQNANALHSRVKARMRVFRGIATKYLAVYLGWIRFFDRAKLDGAPRRFLLDAFGVPEAAAA
jgi:transposase-like protein